MTRILMESSSIHLQMVKKSMQEYKEFAEIGRKCQPIRGRCQLTRRNEIVHLKKSFSIWPDSVKPRERDARLSRRCDDLDLQCSSPSSHFLETGCIRFFIKPDIGYEWLFETNAFLPRKWSLGAGASVLKYKSIHLSLTNHRVVRNTRSDVIGRTRDRTEINKWG